MSASLRIRAGAAGDLPALEALLAAAFPEEDLRPLLRALLALPAGVISRVAVDEGDRPLGLVLMTLCDVDGDPRRAALLGPLCVAPDRQRAGIGAALARDGLARAAAAGAAQAQALGDPAYYGRLGFAPDPDLAPPYPLPDAWRAAWGRALLGEGPVLRGTLLVPPPWRDPALWAP